MARIRSRRKRKRIAIHNDKLNIIRIFHWQPPKHSAIYTIMYNKNQLSIFKNNIKCYENKFNTNN